MAKILSVNKVCAKYHKRMVLQQVSIDVNKGEIVAIVGPNGAGKSTLLKVISGELQAISGSIEMKGKNIARKSQSRRALMGIGYLRQSNNIFPSLTVKENLELANLVNRNNVQNDRTQRVIELFPDLRVLWKRQAALLSGGEHQMLAIAMVLMNESPDLLLLLDEPSSRLAPGMVDRLLAAVKNAREQLSASVLIVEHHVRAALSISDRVYLLKAGSVCLAEDSKSLDAKRIGHVFMGLANSSANK